ncbi:ABC transporter permease subunit [Acetobacter conturbans]|uniref:ABC transporter permease subunit n=1 Tax=Acetobacter conturbans TaxID=1737472 RepID=A0ABX0K110_9PROT|nr:ABC transporter permease subunit [Acetobacter conturbans]NHN88506.1 ABC transporter permease subunit [Acetobacter conturbans]
MSASASSGVTDRSTHPVSAWPGLSMSVAVLCVTGLILGFGSNIPFSPGSFPLYPAALSPSASITALPAAFVVTALRMTGWLMLSFLVAIVGSVVLFGRKQAGNVVLDLLDVLQAVPLPAFVLLTVPLCTGSGGWLGSHALTGEILTGAPLFAAFTFPILASTIRAHRRVPPPLILAARSFGLRAWPRFWRLYVPFGIPAGMKAISDAMPNAWLALAFAEFFAGMKGLPVIEGIGGYSAAAAKQASATDSALALLFMAVLVIAFDRLVVRNLQEWASRFDARASSKNGVTRRFFKDVPLMMKAVISAGIHCIRILGSLPLGPAVRARFIDEPKKDAGLPALLMAAILGVSGFVACAVSPYGLPDITTSLRMIMLGVAELIAILIPLFAYSVLFLPVAVRLKRHANKVLPLLRILTLFPAVLFFPVVVATTGTNTPLSPLLFAGLPFFVAQPLFAGIRTFPRGLLEVARAYRIRGWQRWRSVILPGMGKSWLESAHQGFIWAWNAAIAADITVWGQHVSQHGFIGRAIMAGSNHGGMAYAALGIVIMTLLALGMEFFFWRPLADYVHRRTTGRSQPAIVDE